MSNIKLLSLAKMLDIQVEFLTDYRLFVAEFEVKTVNEKLVKIIKIHMNPTQLLTDAFEARRKFAQRLAHEIAHYLVAPAHRRDANDFGIDREYRMSDYPEDRYHEEERKAQIVTREILLNLGIDHHSMEIFSSKKNFYISYESFQKEYPELMVWWTGWSMHFNKIMAQFQEYNV